MKGSLNGDTSKRSTSFKHRRISVNCWIQLLTILSFLELDLFLVQQWLSIVVHWIGMIGHGRVRIGQMVEERMISGWKLIARIDRINKGWSRINVTLDSTCLIHWILLVITSLIGSNCVIQMEQFDFTWNRIRKLHGNIMRKKKEERGRKREKKF